MQPLAVERLQEIARTHRITYEPLPTPFHRHAVRTRMSRVFRIPKEQLYDKIADVGSHNRYFPHLRALNVITNAELANVLSDNQLVVVEGLAEGGSKLGVKLFTLSPPDRIEGELMTDPFVSARSSTASHNKRGAILWEFEEVDDSHTRMKVESDFEVGPVSAYVHSTVDHVWLDFFENMMIETGELTRADKLCAPFPPTPES